MNLRKDHSDILCASTPINHFALYVTGGKHVHIAGENVDQYIHYPYGLCPAVLSK